MEFIIKTLRTMFYSLDKVIYGLIDNVYGLLIQISKTSVFSQTAIHSFSQRVYALVGIFMLFKVSISLITYVLNPDEFSDKEKGFTSIIKRIILSLVMLVLCPYVFNEAYELQAIILEENTIMTIVFATPSKRVQENLPNSSYVDTAGQLIQFTILYTFAQPNYDEFSHDQHYDLFDCRNTYVTDAKGQYESRTADNPYVYKLNSSCFGVYNESSDKYEAKDEDGQLAKLFADNDYEIAYQDYSQGVAQQSFSLFFKKSVILAKEKDEEERYFINYKYGISTAVGVGVLYLFLMFCIDIAVRSVKLGFLQMISPIPIISYVDPKSGKDGMFSKWFKMCTNTYLELFIRLFALYFGIYTITLVGEFRDVTTGEVVDNWLVKIFMIIGILIFIKKLPDILKKIIGEGMGDFKFTANPLKKFEDEAFGGKRLTGLAAGTAMGVAGMATGAGLARGLGGAWAGLTGNKGWSDTLKNQRDKNAAMRTALLNGSTFGGRMGARFGEALGTGGELARIEREKQHIQDRIDEEKNAKEAIEGRIAPVKQTIQQHKAFADSIKAMETRAKEEIQNGNGGVVGQTYLQKKAEYERLKASGTATSAQIAAAEADMSNYLNDVGMKEYMTQATSGAISDATFSNLRANAEQMGETVGVTLSTDGSVIHSQFGAQKGQIGTLERSIYTEEQAMATHDTNIKTYNDQMQSVSQRESRAKANQNAIK